VRTCRRDASLSSPFGPIFDPPTTAVSARHPAANFDRNGRLRKRGNRLPQLSRLVGASFDTH
jgi:hypothetical protein